MVAQPYECTKNHWILHFKWVNCTVCELNHNKALKNNKRHWFQTNISLALKLLITFQKELRLDTCWFWDQIKESTSFPETSCARKLRGTQKPIGTCPEDTTTWKGLFWSNMEQFKIKNQNDSNYCQYWYQKQRQNTSWKQRTKEWWEMKVLRYIKMSPEWYRWNRWNDKIIVSLFYHHYSNNWIRQASSRYANPQSERILGTDTHRVSKYYPTGFFVSLKLRWDSHHMKLIILECTIQWHLYIHNIVPRPPLSGSKMFSPLQNKIL